MRANVLSTALVALVAIAALGCERDNPAPPDGGPRPDAQIDASRGDGGNDEPRDAQVDAQQRDAQIPDGGDCESRPECWSCAPVLPEHFLNACTDATCFPFSVNQTRLPRLRADGTVPPLP